MSIRAPLLIAAVQIVFGASVAAAQSALSGETIRMSHAAGTITTATSPMKSGAARRDRLEKLDRQLFVKLSYALQR